MKNHLPSGFWPKVSVLLFAQAGIWPQLKLALYFLKVGAVIIGGGYVIIPFLEQEVVGHYGWLTHKEFVDGLALGQMTPGPVAITATFVGYKVGGFLGATLSTVAIFLPGMVGTLLCTRFYLGVHESPWVAAFMKGIKPAVLGVLLVVFYNLGRTFILDPVSMAAVAAALLLLIYTRLETWMLVLAGGILGWLFMR
jgi:chromate transporter